MNIDDYLNELQSNLDNQLARFGMGEQPAGNADNTEATEEKKLFHWLRHDEGLLLGGHFRSRRV